MHKAVNHIHTTTWDALLLWGSVWCRFMLSSNESSPILIPPGGLQWVLHSEHQFCFEIMPPVMDILNNVSCLREIESIVLAHEKHWRRIWAVIVLFSLDESYSVWLCKYQIISCNRELTYWGFWVPFLSIRYVLGDSPMILKSLSCFEAITLNLLLIENLVLLSTAKFTTNQILYFWKLYRVDVNVFNVILINSEC